MKTKEEYFKYLKEKLLLENSAICESILNKVNDSNLKDISKMLFFLYKVEGIRIATYTEFQRL